MLERSQLEGLTKEELIEELLFKENMLESYKTLKEIYKNLYDTFAQAYWNEHKKDTERK